MEKTVLGINLKDRMWNEELKRRSGIEDAAKAARRLKWRWGGHVARMDICHNSLGPENRKKKQRKTTT
jgi:hypothetical protein